MLWTLAPETERHAQNAVAGVGGSESSGRIMAGIGIYEKGGHLPTHDRSKPRKSSLYKMTRKLLVEQATKLGSDSKGKCGYGGWLKSCIEHDPIAVLKILMTKRNKVTAITAINNITDEWKLSMIEKMESQGFKLIEGQINEEETEDS